MFGRTPSESSYLHKKTSQGLFKKGEVSSEAKADEAVDRYGKALDRRISQQQEKIDKLVSQGSRGDVVRAMVLARRKEEQAEDELLQLADQERHAQEQELMFREVEHDLEREAFGYLAERVYKDSIEALDRGTWERVPLARLANTLNKIPAKGMFTVLRLVQQSNYQSYLMRTAKESLTYREFVDVQTLPFSIQQPMSEVLLYTPDERRAMKMQDSDRWLIPANYAKDPDKNREQYKYYIVDDTREIDEQLHEIQSSFNARQERECVEVLMRPWGLVPLSFLGEQPKNSMVIGRISHVTDGSTTWQIKTADYISRGLVPAFGRLISDTKKTDEIVRTTNELEAHVRGKFEKKVVITQIEYCIVETKEEIERVFGAA